MVEDKKSDKLEVADCDLQEKSKVTNRDLKTDVDITDCDFKMGE